MKSIKIPKRILQFGCGIAVIAAAFLFLSNSNYLFPREEKILAPSLRKPQEVVYKTYAVEKSIIENRITCQGYFIPDKEIDISFHSRDGYLKALYINLGQIVTKGDILAVLDTDNLVNEIKRQTLTLKGVEEGYQKLNDISEIDIAINRLQLEELKSELERKYVLKDSLAQIEIIKHENQVAIKEQILNKLRLEYEYQAAAAIRDIEMARIRLDELKLELYKSTITAPISGKITYVAYMNIGEYIPSYKTLIKIADPHRILIQYTGNKYINFQLGMVVQVNIENQTFDGEVTLTPSQVPMNEYEQMKEKIYIRVNEVPDASKVGDAVSIEVTLEKAEDVIVLPKRLVHKYSGRWFVKILENGLVNERDIAVGIQSPIAYEIIGGLEVGDLVVE